MEGTAGSTGISLAMIAAAKGYRCRIFMPSDQAIEKSEMLKRYGAEVSRVPPVSISNPEHFCNLAKRSSTEDPNNVFYADQFENLANYRAHYNSTGPEIWSQTKGNIHALVLAAGTGGTLAGALTQQQSGFFFFNSAQSRTPLTTTGTASYLKEKQPSLKVIVADPPGSGLYNRINFGVMYANEEAEGRRKRNQVDTITEGIGINRLTSNFKQLPPEHINAAVRVTDKESVEMAHFLLKAEGLFVGSSSAANCVGAVKAAKLLGKGHIIVTILADGGHRHLTKLYNPQFLEPRGLLPQAKHLEFVIPPNDIEINRYNKSLLFVSNETETP